MGWLDKAINDLTVLGLAFVFSVGILATGLFWFFDMLFKYLA